jgi:hypothetical protein
MDQDMAFELRNANFAPYWSPVKATSIKESAIIDKFAIIYGTTNSGDIA